MGKGKVARAIVDLLANYYQINFIVNGMAMKITNKSVNEMYDMILPYLKNPDKEYVTDRLIDSIDYWNQQIAGKKDFDFDDFVEGDLDITLLDSLYLDLIEDEELKKAP